MTARPLMPRTATTADPGDPEVGALAHAPRLSFADPASEATFGPPYRAALENLLVTNTVPYDADEYGGSGLMAPDPPTFVRAGGGYAQPWTRDASVNAWNAASLLTPDVARNTLWSVVDRDAEGGLQVRQDDQVWDQVVWVTGAWNHYVVTGDREFLRDAYATARNTLEIRLGARDPGFDERFGLFTGPSFFNDGVSGFPAPPADPEESRGSGSFSYPGIRAAMFLSTNCLYYAAFVHAARMADALGLPESESAPYRERAALLRRAVNDRFWNPGTGLYRYMVLPDGTLGEHQEGTGLAFALMFGIADEARARSVLARTATMPAGIADVWPHFERYDDAAPGRHNAVVWPLVQGFWGQAAAQYGDVGVFARNLTQLARLAAGGGGFWEIFHGVTGAVDGGHQRLDDEPRFHWGSEPDQTWSATAYLRLVHEGVFGLRYDADGLGLTPLLPAGWGDMTLAGVRYRDAVLTIRLRGAGARVASVRLDGAEQAEARIPATLAGPHTVDVVMTESS